MLDLRQQLPAMQYMVPLRQRNVHQHLGLRVMLSSSTNLLYTPTPVLAGLSQRN
jgi:hypothetical protein